MISSEALGANGREVRCGKCGHMWFQPGERDSLDDLPPAPPEQDMGYGDDDISFENHKEPEPIPEVLKSRREKVAIEKEYQPSKLDKYISPERRSQVAAVLVALLIVVGLAYELIDSRDMIGRQVPFMAGAYEELGLPLTKVKPQIAIDRLTLTKQGTKMMGTANLINLTSDSVPVKHIVAELTDFDYKTLKSMDVKMDDKSLKGESSHKIEFTFDDVPKDAVSVRVKITE